MNPESLRKANAARAAANLQPMARQGAVTTSEAPSKNLDATQLRAEVTSLRQANNELQQRAKTAEGHHERIRGELAREKDKARQAREEFDTILAEKDRQIGALQITRDAAKPGPQPGKAVSTPTGKARGKAG